MSKLMNDDSITTADVHGRARVGLLAQTNPSEALAVARAIRHPWYRCQALAQVAEHWGTRAQRMDVLQEALGTAQMQEEVNRIVSVSAWPLRVMLPLSADEVEKHLNKLVAQANVESHSLRRADALFMLSATVEGHPTLLALIMPSLVRALMDGYGWRIDRLIRFSAAMVKNSMPEALEQLVAHHSEGRKKQLLIARLAESPV